MGFARMATDLRLDRNSVAVEGGLVVEGNALRVGTKKGLQLTTGGARADLQVGNNTQPGRIRVLGRGNGGFLHVQGLIRSSEIDTAKLSAGGVDLLARIADLERRIAALER